MFFDGVRNVRECNAPGVAPAAPASSPQHAIAASAVRTPAGYWAALAVEAPRYPGRVAGAIEAEKLERAFKDVRAVAGIDLVVANGEIYGFLGPNGADKSTTVHMLTTLLPPTGGRATVAGFDVVRQGPRVRASIGAALQEAALDPFLTGREHLRLGSSLHGIGGVR